MEKAHGDLSLALERLSDRQDLRSDRGMHFLFRGRGEI
jgi:hypothetical protein